MQITVNSLIQNILAGNLKLSRNANLEINPIHNLVIQISVQMRLVTTAVVELGNLNYRRLNLTFKPSRGRGLGTVIKSRF